MDTQPLTPKTMTTTADTAFKAKELAPRPGETAQTAQAVPEAANAERGALEREQLKELAARMEELAGSFNRGLRFSVDEDSGRQVVTVVDKTSGETIRQIPTEELLDIIARLAEASGGLIDVKV
ncbi:flagellar protein FlaG [Zobellella denitrificans]